VGSWEGERGRKGDPGRRTQDAGRRESQNGSHLRLGYGGQWIGGVGEREKEDAGKKKTVKLFSFGLAGPCYFPSCVGGAGVVKNSFFLTTTCFSRHGVFQVD